MSAEEPQAGLKKGGLESLSHEELVAKCKNLLIIAQKAKKAKDDALEELSNQETKHKEELKAVRDKVSTDGTQSIQIKKNLLDLQLEFDSCQKKMSSLEEEHKVCNAKIKKLEHQLSIEYDKRKNAELLNNNLNEDLNKLTESSGQMRLICKQVMEEKENIEKDFKEIFQQKIEWTRYLQTAHPNESITSVKDWIAILESRRSSDGDLEEENKHLKDTNEEMKKKVEKMEKVIEDLINKRDGVSSEIVSLKKDKAKMMEELNEVRASRDALLKKMDEVRIETTQLIENSEKLSEENGVLRVEKDKFQNSFTSLSVEHAKLLKEIEVLKAYNEELNKNLRVKFEEEEKGEEVENMREKLKEMEEMRRKLTEMEDMRTELEKIVEVKFAEEEIMKKKLEEMESIKLKLGEKEGLEIKLKEMEDKKLAEEKEIENLRVELKETKSELDSLKGDYSLLQTDKNSADNRVNELESCVKNLEEKIVELTKNLEETTKENSEKLALSIENADMKKQLETMSGEYAELLSKTNEQERKIRSLEETVQDLESRCSRYEGVCKEFKSDIESKRDAIIEQKGEIFGLNEKCTGLENKVKKLKQELDEQILNKDKVLNELETLKQLSGKQIEELKEIEKTLKQKLVEQNEQKEKIVKNLNEECEKLKNEVERLKLEKENEMVKERESQESTKSDLIQKLNVLEKQIVEKSSEFEAFESAKSELIKKLNEAEKQLEEKNSEFEAFESTKLELTKKLNVAEKRLELKISEFEALESAKSELTKTLNVAEKQLELKISEFEALESTKSDLIDKFNQIQKQLEEKNFEFEAFKSTESELIEKLNKLEIQLEMKNSLLLSKVEEERISAERLKDLESLNLDLKNEKECLEKEKRGLESYIKDLQTDKEELENEKKVLESKIEELRSLAKESSDKTSAHSVSVTESQTKLEEYEVMKCSLEEYREKLRKTLEDNKKTEETIDDLKCETGKLNSLLVVVREERDKSSTLLHKCQLEKRDLETQVEKLRLEDEENLHNLQDLNDRYLSMEEKLNFIFSENEELKGKVGELEEIHDNLLKEIENIIGNNVHILPETVVNEFQNKSVKFDSLVLLKYLSEIISGLSNNIQEKDKKVEGLNGEVVSVRKELENALKSCKELENVLKCSKDLEKVLDEGLSGFKSVNIESKVKLLSRVVQDTRFFEELYESYAKITGADLQEAKKALKLRLEEAKENDWKCFLNSESEEGGKKKADEVREKEEEIAQLQDKNKELKGVAVKMKKKINDLNQLLESERQKVDAERTKLNQLSAVAKNAQMLQQECDRLTDELEECKKTIKQLQKVNDNLENEHKDLQQKYNEKENRFTEIEKEMAAVRAQLESAVSKEASLVKELEEVKTEKHVEEVIRKECEKELIITQDKLRKVQLELDQALLESQKHTVLTQEKHDYEQQLNQSHQTLTQLESKLKEASSTLAQLTGQLETERSDKDELADQLTKLTAESQKTIEAARVQNEALLNRVSQLESDLRSVSADRQRFEEEATRLASEFGAYKVRAQSVLRQKEQGGSSAEQEARDKCAHWQQMCDRTKAQLDATVEELEQVRLKLDSVVAEKDALDKKCENINNILLQRNKEIDRRMMEHRQHKLSTDTLIQCYKTQLEEKERGHQIELESLRQQLSKLSSRVNNIIDADLAADADAVKVDNANYYQSTEHTLTTAAGSHDADNTRHSPIEIVGEHGKSLPPRPPLIEREDGEGSEGNEISMFPGSLSNKTGLVPLAKLLSSSLGSDEERDVLSLEKFESLQNEMLASNARVKHLAALLSEAEKDSALMEEQNTMLKEEIRRLQRCIERQPHAHNVEYLKNVVFKFATLASGDEKSRLVPVLDTILKLSPEEHKQLTAVAKGETEQTSGWSSYLPTWQ
ncbi:hypothetical protein LSTR_LSTR008128 [Laodelphax striatellus]|uniref:GRIP domain-containing protein n=1 Tax=Laodelphax striatellus TaxID=195883 RepID=A0A482XTG5_LAOST|nr:hypothetical protein LSTR_LSTR008128 [Laodelphax striatellus]